VVGALGRRAHEVHIEAINMYMIDLKDKIVAEFISKLFKNKRDITTR